MVERPSKSSCLPRQQLVMLINVYDQCVWTCLQAPNLPSVMYVPFAFGMSKQWLSLDLCVPRSGPSALPWIALVCDPKDPTTYAYYSLSIQVAHNRVCDYLRGDASCDCVCYKVVKSCLKVYLNLQRICFSCAGKQIETATNVPCLCGEILLKCPWQLPKDGGWIAVTPKSVPNTCFHARNV